MKIIDWKALGTAERDAVLARPDLAESRNQTQQVRQIIDQVKADGDAALREYTRRFDRVAIDAIRMTPDEIDAVADSVSPELQSAIDAAVGTLRRWHQATVPAEFEVETAPGVTCGRVIRPVRAVGLYVPAGSAPLPSTALMLGVPAQLAGCAEVVLCSPPGPDGEVDAAVVAAARAVGINIICRVGGVQAVAGMAYGTESVSRCDKIFGPGNSWVTRAKQMVAQDPRGAAIDMPAGPSEVLVIADAQADPTFVAIDLLSQAEHGPDSQAILLTSSAALAEATEREVKRLLGLLPRADIAREALAHSRLIVVGSLSEALAVSNRYAPEHLILQAEDAAALVPGVMAAGSIFVGRWAPEALGDYCSGTNHVLPTYGWARSYSGVSVDSFLNRISVQEVTAAGLDQLGPVAETLAAAEGLDAHRLAVSLRREKISEGAS